MNQVTCTFQSLQGDKNLNYLLFLPKDYPNGQGKKWPLIFFLHGGDERGDNIELLKRHGIPKLVEYKLNFPFVTVSPQIPSRLTWTVYLPSLIELLDSVLNWLAIDRDRVYLTGLSMGGFAAWHLAAKYPHYFAAIAPICGGGLASEGFPRRVRRLKDTPVWAFHGQFDDIVPPEESEKLVNELNSCGGNVKFTLYCSLGHDCWTRTYNNPALYHWFLSHRRPE